MAKNRCAWQRSLIRLGTEMFPAAYASTIRASICKDTDSDQFTNATCKINIYIYKYVFCAIKLHQKDVQDYPSMQSQNLCDSCSSVQFAAKNTCCQE